MSPYRTIAARSQSAAIPVGKGGTPSANAAEGGARQRTAETRGGTWEVSVAPRKLSLTPPATKVWGGTESCLEKWLGHTDARNKITSFVVSQKQAGARTECSDATI